MDYESSLIGDFPVAPFSFPILLRKLYLRRIKDDGKLINTSRHHPPEDTFDLRNNNSSSEINLLLVDSGIDYRSWTRTHYNKKTLFFLYVVAASVGIRAG